MPHPRRPDNPVEKALFDEYYSKGDHRNPSIPPPPFYGFPADCDPSQICLDWVWSMRLDVYICNDLAWFLDYVPWRSTAPKSVLPLTVTKPSPEIAYLPVLGIGTVDLPVRLAPHLHGPAAHGILRLHHVLYIPTCPFNFMGGLDTDDYWPLNYHTVRFGNYCTIPGVAGEIVSPEDINYKLAYFDKRDDLIPGLMTLHLSGAPILPKLANSQLSTYYAGPQGQNLYPLEFRWNGKEFDRWHDVFHDDPYYDERLNTTRRRDEQRKLVGTDGEWN
ncbi:hypothetical protein B0T18DRAFT_462412 [Schizothecium vesticola]|uniref:Uncharacterized protein n=1 Tax=Schizothecium vesticola TaxID=314040 RepID=A0AA40F3F9_9PEZI|nr:hypothetical protein B0T18DRAFT_462412 [Schizothecium vesticola]